jgi:hypothetical protein
MRRRESRAVERNNEIGKSNNQIREKRGCDDLTTMTLLPLTAMPDASNFKGSV